ncbi:hypothetical protein L0222_14340 [bacterium]|nr:hypothetical protein [bacterium]
MDDQNERIRIERSPGAAVGDVRIGGDAVYGDIKIEGDFVLSRSRSSYEVFVDEFCSPGLRYCRHFLGGTMISVGAIWLLTLIQIMPFRSSMISFATLPAAMIAAGLVIFGLSATIEGFIGGILQTYRNTALYHAERKFAAWIFRTLVRFAILPSA